MTHVTISGIGNLFNEELADALTNSEFNQAIVPILQNIQEFPENTRLALRLIADEVIRANNASTLKILSAFEDERIKELVWSLQHNIQLLPAAVVQLLHKDFITEIEIAFVRIKDQLLQTLPDKWLLMTTIQELSEEVGRVLAEQTNLLLSKLSTQDLIVQLTETTKNSHEHILNAVNATDWQVEFEHSLFNQLDASLSKLLENILIDLNKNFEILGLNQQQLSSELSKTAVDTSSMIAVLVQNIDKQFQNLSSQINASAVVVQNNQLLCNEMIKKTDSLASSITLLVKNSDNTRQQQFESLIQKIDTSVANIAQLIQNNDNNNKKRFDDLSLLIKKV
ncbi:MAG: hypothetical protein MUO31_05510 [Thermodesulfovibrionales bacterium]|nr:hypothetical protein [Thermodesulfovibrionales bacterium]